MAWIQAVSLNDLGDKPVVFNHPPRQIALFTIDDRIFAVDNRCPHEGYPLAAGNVTDDCVLTCNWHNWKFRLSDGECLLGRRQRSKLPDAAEGRAPLDRYLGSAA